MSHLLQPVGKPARWFAILALSLAILVLLAVEGFLIALPLFAEHFNPDRDTPILLGIIALFGVFLLVFVWMLVRILKSKSLAPGATAFPRWAIRLAGLGYLSGMVFLAVTDAVPTLLLIEGTFIAMAMILVARSSGPSAVEIEVNEGGHALVIFNDETHSYAYVQQLLLDVCGIPHDKGFYLADTISSKGQAAIYIGTREECERRQRQVEECGPDTLMPNSIGPIQSAVERWNPDPSTH